MTMEKLGFENVCEFCKQRTTCSKVGVRAMCFDYQHDVRSAEELQKAM